MLKKNYSTSGNICRVTFKYKNSEGSKKAVLVGDFNEWSLQDTPMKKLKDGSFSTTLSLQAGNSYQFRYVLDGNTWVNDVEADSYVTNQYGEENSVVTV
jgi:1,4-alpha-glucan branching enzyme